MSRALAALGLLAALSGCTTFPAIEPDECGNGVKEKGEDCDTSTEMVEGGICRPKGVLGECHWDCRPNSDGTRGNCPYNFGCAADGICRAATGEFDAPSLISSDLSSWVSAVNFDGDRRSELLSMELTDQVQQGRFRLHYFDEDTNLVETRTFPSVTTRPIVHQLDGGVGDDLVFSNFRVGMLPGRADRELVPAAFSSYVVDDSELRAVAVSDDPIGQAIGLAAFTKLRGVEGIYVPSNDRGRLQLRWDLRRPLAQLVGTPSAADLFTGTSSPCQELVYGFQGERVVHVLDMCELGTDPLRAELQWREAPLEQLIALPSGSKLDAQPVSADVDGDGHRDLLISASGLTHVAYGDGARLQSRAEPLSIWIQKEEDEAEEAEGEDQASFVPTVLAAGDITGDGVADLVLPNLVLGSRRSLIDSSTVYFGAFGNNALPWTTAHVVDLNGNGRLDVIAATEGERGLSFLNGTSAKFPVGVRIATRGPVRLLGCGNFDGDSSTDITFLEQSAPGRNSETLWVAYGQQDGLPLEPTRIAELSGVQQLGRQRDRGVDDIFTTSKSRVAGNARGTFTLFSGDASRLPLAPYTLVEFKKDDSLVDYFSPVLLLGAFTRPDQQDVLALGSQDIFVAWNQWLIPGIGAGLEPPRLLRSSPIAGVVPATLADNGGARLSVAGAAADIDGDGLDEAVWLMPEGGTGCALMIYDIEPGTGIGDDTGAAALLGKLSFAESCAEPELTAADIDGDRRADLLLLLGHRNSPARSLQILWNDHGFSLDERTVLGGDELGNVRGFSLFPGAERIAFVTESSLFFASRSGRQFDVAQGLGTFRDARSVVVTDPNGDRFQDVVVADSAGLWLLEAELK